MSSEPEYRSTTVVNRTSRDPDWRHCIIPLHPLTLAALPLLLSSRHDSILPALCPLSKVHSISCSKPLHLCHAVRYQTTCCHPASRLRLNLSCTGPHWMTLAVSGVACGGVSQSQSLEAPHSSQSRVWWESCSESWAHALLPFC